MSGSTATERFKRLLADALERVCVLEAQLETAQARVTELEAQAHARRSPLLTSAHPYTPDGRRKDTKKPEAPCP